MKRPAVRSMRGWISRRLSYLAHSSGLGWSGLWNVVLPPHTAYPDVRTRPTGPIRRAVCSTTGLPDESSISLTTVTAVSEVEDGASISSLRWSVAWREWVVPGGAERFNATGAASSTRTVNSKVYCGAVADAAMPARPKKAAVARRIRMGFSLFAVDCGLYY